jgi:ATP-dependent helicase HepA
VRTVIDLRGNDHTATREATALAADFVDGTIQRFLARPGFNAALLKNLLATATEKAEALAVGLKTEAAARAESALGAELRRLQDLGKVNDHVRPEEIELAREQLGHIRTAVEGARLRLDSIRLIVEGPGAAE